MTTPVNPTRAARQGAGDQRRPAGDDPARPGASGDRAGLSGAERSALLAGWLFALAIVLMIMVFDILTRSHNQPKAGVLQPIVDEGSSALVTSVVILLPALIGIWVRRRSPVPWQAALAYGLAAAAYPALHVGGFVVVRKLAYPGLLHRTYEFGPLPGEFLYEAAKDVPAFAFAAVAFWLILRWWPAPQTAASPAWIDIRDGARLVRAPVADILAIRSAGNYAEFLLADGRRPLMRASLSALEARLAPLGFVRTHRSWLVNPARVTGLRPEGSGDYAVELGSVEAPLSRRFPQALAALRA